MQNRFKVMRRSDVRSGRQLLGVGVCLAVSAPIGCQHGFGLVGWHLGVHDRWTARTDEVGRRRRQPDDSPRRRHEHHDVWRALEGQLFRQRVALGPTDPATRRPARRPLFPPCRRQSMVPGEARRQSDRRLDDVERQALSVVLPEVSGRDSVPPDEQSVSSFRTHCESITPAAQRLRARRNP